MISSWGCKRPLLAWHGCSILHLWEYPLRKVDCTIFLDIIDKSIFSVKACSNQDLDPTSLHIWRKSILLHEQTLSSWYYTCMYYLRIHVSNLTIFDKFGIFYTCRCFWYNLPKWLRDVVQSFGKICYLVFIQDNLTPLPLSILFNFPKNAPGPPPPPILYGYKIANFPETLDHIP